MIILYCYFLAGDYYSSYIFKTASLIMLRIYYCRASFYAVILRRSAIMIAEILLLYAYHLFTFIRCEMRDISIIISISFGQVDT